MRLREYKGLAYSGHASVTRDLGSVDFELEIAF